MDCKKPGITLVFFIFLFPNQIINCQTDRICPFSRLTTMKCMKNFWSLLALWKELGNNLDMLGQEPVFRFNFRHFVYSHKALLGPVTKRPLSHGCFDTCIDRNCESHRNEDQILYLANFFTWHYSAKSWLFFSLFCCHFPSLFLIPKSISLFSLLCGRKIKNWYIYKKSHEAW